MRRELPWKVILISLLALTLAALACNAPVIGEPVTPTPWIVFVTATPENVSVPVVPPPLGGFAGGAAPALESTLVEPTLDTSGIAVDAPTVIFQEADEATATAAVATAQPTGPTPALSPTPTVVVAIQSPAPSATLQPGLTPSATVAPPSPTPFTATQQPGAQALGSATPVPSPVYVANGTRYADTLGLNFINSAQHDGDEARFVAGVGTGVGWDRFAIYWFDIEATAGSYNWSLYDPVVSSALANGFKVDGILLGTAPPYYGPNGVPNGLYEPVFADGTDTPGPGKQINPNNPWARWVYATVNRYKPGGDLGRASGWSSTVGIRVWEIWNEPDFTMFWQGSVTEYARLLKVAYLAARQADSGARIMLGGLVIWEQPGWLIDLLTLYRNDPAPAPDRYPFDMVAIHAYSFPLNSFELTSRTQGALAAFGQSSKPIWINESGVPVWDDYPGPTWSTRQDQRIWRASLNEQAAYVIQNAAYAYLAEAATLFHFQLYDDCGNQPRGSNFAPHNGALCDTGAVCWGDALGVMRNASDNVCFTQHPQPNSPRPSYAALRVVSDVFGSANNEPLGMSRLDNNAVTALYFARPSSREIISVLWNETGSARTIALPARGAQAILVDQSGASQTLTPDANGNYSLTLQPATNRNQPVPLSREFMIGGPPLILIEVEPDPVVSIAPLPANSRQALIVRWRTNALEISKFEVWYRDDTAGNEWILWFDTGRPGNAVFAGGAGRTYSFFARGQRADGTWTHDTPFPQATTRLDG